MKKTFTKTYKVYAPALAKKDHTVYWDWSTRVRVQGFLSRGLRKSQGIITLSSVSRETPKTNATASLADRLQTVILKIIPTILTTVRCQKDSRLPSERVLWQISRMNISKKLPKTNGSG